VTGNAVTGYLRLSNALTLIRTRNLIVRIRTAAVDGTGRLHRPGISERLHAKFVLRVKPIGTREWVAL